MLYAIGLAMGLIIRGKNRQIKKNERFDMNVGLLLTNAVETEHIA